MLIFQPRRRATGYFTLACQYRISVFSDTARRRCAGCRGKMLTVRQIEGLMIYKKGPQREMRARVVRVVSCMPQQSKSRLPKLNQPPAALG